MHLDNAQMIMITEMKPMIEKLKEEGKEYLKIKEAVLKKYKDGHWLITDNTRREEAIGAALFAYAMDDDMREKVKELQKVTGRIFV
jgi:hypothetical protein